MKTIGALEAKNHLSELLQKVADGDSFLITRWGKPIASLLPVNSGTVRGSKHLIVDFRKRFAKSLRPFPNEEIGILKRTNKR